MSFEQWPYIVRMRLRTLLRRGAVEQELDDELRYHVERQIEENIASGMPADEARRAALRALGRIERRKDECRDAWGITLLDHLARDARQALRALRRDVGFTVGVLALLSLGIGANAAVFSIVDGILLEPLPYPEPERLFVVRELTPERSSDTRSVNGLHFHEWRRACDCFTGIALAEYVQQLNLSAGGEPERVPTVRVTPNAFPVLGVSAQLGRTLVPGDEDAGESAPIVISDGLWRRRFGAAPDVIGRSIELDGVPSVIVGVLPKGFEHHWGREDSRVDVYRAWDAAPQDWWGWTNNYSYSALARLEEGMSADEALERLNAVQAAIADEHFRDTEWRAVSLEAVLIPLHEWVTGESRDGLLMLLAGVAAALLVACVNIANLMLARATERTREAGIRGALGASRTAIFRGSLIESGLLAGAGAAAGVVIAFVGVRLFTSLAGAGLPRAASVELDGSVLAAVVALAVGSTFAFGLLPALQMTRVDPQRALKTSGRSFTESSERAGARQALVSIEVALSTALLIVAGLLLTSFVRLGGVERGFNAENVLTAEIGLPFARYPDDDARLRFYQSLLERLDAEPRVVAAGVTSALPLSGTNWGSTALPLGANPPAEERPRIEYRFVSPGYLEAMGIPILAGRSLAPREYRDYVAVISERTAMQVWGEPRPLGRRFHMGDPDEPTYEVVGIVPDVPSEDLAVEPAPIVYAPLAATPGIVFPIASVSVRTAGDPAAAAGLLREAVRSLDPGLAIGQLRTMSEIEASTLAERRFQLVLVVAFGAASLLIAALGTYAVLSYGVASREQELAVRLALGAPANAVRSLVLRQGLRPVLVGLAAGIAVAWLSGGLLSSLLYAVAPGDPAILATVAAVTLIAALLACWLPAHKAGRMPLLDSLRYE
ncbi:MAG TPA: ABC transporter permease [Gammaproteobacteria bacterium]